MDAWAIVIGAGDAKQAGQLALGRSRRRGDRGPAGVRREADVEVGKGLALPWKAGWLRYLRMGSAVWARLWAASSQRMRHRQAALGISDRITE